MAIERLGDILLLERQATGGMAEVFRAKQYGHGGFEKTIAVKRILPIHSSSEDFKRMFRLEANLSAQLQHPNIAQVFSNGAQGEYLYLVMEYVEGINLRQLFLKAGSKGVPLPVELACFIICETAKGLDFAHAFVDEKTGNPLNIVHRDVNHQNIMLSYEGAVKIVDFGVAKATEEDTYKTRAGVLKGKVAYMSPEQVRGKKIDRRTDIFSLGIVLWELLSGQALFIGDDEFGSLENVRNCVVPSLSEQNFAVFPTLEKIVMRALAKNPDDRYQTAKEFGSDLQRYLNEHHPQFIQADVSAYLKELFKEEIAEEKNRKEASQKEAKEYLQKYPILKSTHSGLLSGSDSSPPSKLMPQNNLKVLKSFEEATIVSQPALEDQQSSVEKRLEALNLTANNVLIPNVEYEHTGAHSSVYSNAIQNQSAKMMVLFVVVVVGVVYMWFRERERLLFASYENSKMEKWSEQFRSNFVESCASTVSSRFEVDSNQYCYCLSSSVEGAHILSTKFNPNVTSAENLAQNNLALLQNYMNSESGRIASDACIRKISGSLEEHLVPLEEGDSNSSGE